MSTHLIQMGYRDRDKNRGPDFDEKCKVHNINELNAVDRDRDRQRVKDTVIEVQRQTKIERLHRLSKG